MARRRAQVQNQAPAPARPARRRRGGEPLETPAVAVAVVDARPGAELAALLGQTPPPPNATPAAPVTVTSADAQRQAFELAGRFIELDKELKRIKTAKKLVGFKLLPLVERLSPTDKKLTLADGSSVSVGENNDSRPSKKSLIAEFGPEKTHAYWEKIRKKRKFLTANHAGEVVCPGAAPSSDEDEEDDG